MDATPEPRLVVITGPIASGKNTTAEALVRRITACGLRVVLADLDDVAWMVGPPGAVASGLWFAAHEAHGALVGQWLRSAVDLVIAVGPIYTSEEQHALTHHLPERTRTDWVVLDAPVDVTLARATADPTRMLSRDPDFHRAAHARFTALTPDLPGGLRLDTSSTSVDDITGEIESHLEL